MVSLLAYGTLSLHVVVSRDGFYHTTRGIAYANLRGRLLLLLYRLSALMLDISNGQTFLHYVDLHLLTRLYLMG